MALYLNRIMRVLVLLSLLLCVCFSTDPGDVGGKGDLASAIPPPPVSEINALIAFSRCIINGPDALSSWNVGSTDADPCADGWDGIKCKTDGKTKTHIFQLDLGDRGLLGPVHEALLPLQALPYLEHVALYDNALTGTLPQALQMPSLTLLRLDDNPLAGALPTGLGSDWVLPLLEYLDLHSTRLTGPVRPELGRLRTLQKLYLYNCSFSGTLPRELGHLPMLLSLRLDHNALTGVLPPWTTREGLDFMRRDSVPAGDNDRPADDSLTERWRTLQLLQSIEYLDLSHNQLTGTLPSSLGTLLSLQELHLYANRFTGEIPPSLGRLASLLALRLDRNQLTGQIPVELLQLTSLHFLGLGKNNRLSGTIPDYASHRRNVTAEGRVCDPAAQHGNGTDADASVGGARKKENPQYSEALFEPIDTEMLAALKLASRIVFTNQTAHA